MRPCHRQESVFVQEGGKFDVCEAQTKHLSLKYRKQCGEKEQEGRTKSSCRVSTATTRSDGLKHSMGVPVPSCLDCELCAMVEKSSSCSLFSVARCWLGRQPSLEPHVGSLAPGEV